MKNNKSIGQLIKEEAESQGLSAEDLGKMIGCEDKNVYKIFKKTHLNTAQLGLIGKKLNRNFFLDLAKDPELSGVNDPEAITELTQSMAVAQFVEVMPRILLELGIEPYISLGRQVPLDNNVPVPNYFIGNYNISFTVGCHLFEKMDINYRKFMPVERHSFNNPSFTADLWQQPKGNMLDLVLEYRPEHEWKQIMKQVFTNFYPK